GRGSSAGGARLDRLGERGAEAHGARVERRAHDHAGDARDGGQLTDILERSHPAGRDDGDLRGAGERFGAPDVGPGLGAVPRDISVDDGAGARGRGVARERYRLELEHAGPTVDRYAAVGRVEPQADAVL